MSDATSALTTPFDDRPRRRRSRNASLPRLTVEEIARDFGHLPPVVTVAQLAEALGRAESTIHHWRCQGRLEGTYRKRGGRLHFLRTKVLQHIFNEPEWGDARKAA